MNLTPRTYLFALLTLAVGVAGHRFLKQGNLAEKATHVKKAEIPMRPQSLHIRPVSLGTPLTPERLHEERIYKVLESGDTERQEIALTFDDGPHPEFAPKLLKRLKELNVKATFFVVGERVTEYPQTVRDIKSAGHEIASHTYSHQNLRRISLDKVEQEVLKANIAIKNATGEYPVFFRPPGGQYDDAVLQIVRRHSLTTALWTENPADYKTHSPQEEETWLLKRAHSGSIFLLHSGVENTYQMLPSLVSQLRARGYHFVTLSQMTRPAEDQNRVARR